MMDWEVFRKRIWKYLDNRLGHIFRYFQYLDSGLGNVKMMDWVVF